VFHLCDHVCECVFHLCDRVCVCVFHLCDRACCRTSRSRPCCSSLPCSFSCVSSCPVVRYLSFLLFQPAPKNVSVRPLVRTRNPSQLHLFSACHQSSITKSICAKVQMCTRAWLTQTCYCLHCCFFFISRCVLLTLNTCSFVSCRAGRSPALCMTPCRR
jgi:hypothetical protein